MCAHLCFPEPCYTHTNAHVRAHLHTHTHTHTNTQVILPIWIFHTFPEDRLFFHGCILCPCKAVTPYSHVPFLRIEP